MNQLTPALNLQNYMELNIKIKISGYMVGATGPNRTGLFARVAPVIIPVNLGRGGDFYNRFTH